MKSPTLIQRIIYYSKTILALKSLKLIINQAEERAKAIDVILFTFKNSDNTIKTHIDEQKEEIDRRIKEIGAKIRFLLEPISKGKLWIYDESIPWCLTVEDMRKGYSILEETDSEGNYKGDDYRHVLFLSSYKDIKRNIPEGTLLPFKQVATILGNLKDVYGNQAKLSDYIIKRINDKPKILRHDNRKQSKIT